MLARGGSKGAPGKNLKLLRGKPLIYYTIKAVQDSGVFESSEFKSQREQLRKLYQDLCLALTAQQAETAEELSRVRKGKKTIETYRSNI